MEKKKINIYALVVICLIVFAMYSIFAIFKLYPLNFGVKTFNYPIKPITINFELKEKIQPEKILLCFNDYCSNVQSDLFLNVYSYEFNQNNEEFFKSKVKNIYLAYPDYIGDLKDKIEDINVYIGNDRYNYNSNDIKNFKEKSFLININNSKTQQKYKALVLPESNNYKGLFNHISILFLSLFYNWQFFIIPYVWIFFAFLIYLFNKDKFNFKFSNKAFYTVAGIVFIIGVILRIVDIGYYPLWTDEVYTAKTAIKGLSACLYDPGNPPLFFILECLFTKIFSLNYITLRILPCIFGIMFPIAAYILFKDFSKKEGLFAAFLASVNLINIYFSNEARGYSLCMLLSLIMIYLLFKYLKNPNTKNLVFYTIAIVLASNLNYYLILFIVSNFIWGVVDLIENKNKKEILNYFMAHFIAFLTFLPYFILQSHNALSKTFNGWIPELNKETFLYTINAYFNNKYVFLFLSVILLINIIFLFIPFDKIKEKINPKKENMLVYLVYTLTMIIISASLISIFIKPIFHKRVLFSIYGLLFLIEALVIVSVFELNKFNKFLKAFYSFIFVSLTFTYFSITKPMPLKEICNLDDFMNFISIDSKKYQNDYEIHAMTTDTEDYLLYYPEVKKLKNIKWHFIDTNNGSVVTSIRKEDFTNSKKAVIYFNSIGVDTQRIVTFNPNIRVYKSNLNPTLKLIYD